MGDQTRAHVFYYGLDPKADLWADNIDGLGLDGYPLPVALQR